MRKLVGTIGAIVGMSTVAAAAQSSADTQPDQLEAVTVVARKITENLQDTPISVVSISGEALDRQGVSNVRSLAMLVPSLNIAASQGGGTSTAQIFLRGVGQWDFIGTTDQKVGVYVDGVYIARSVGAAMDLYGLDNVEVLRGPQGTLFGRNTTGGAILITTRAPTNDTQASVGLTYGSRNHVDIRGLLNAPIIDGVLLGEITAARFSQDGYVRDLFTGNLTGGGATDAVRGKLKWIINDAVDLTLTGDYTRKNGDPAAESTVALFPAVTALFNPGLTAQGLPAIDNRVLTGPYASYLNEISRDENTAKGVAADLTWKISDKLQLKSQTAYRRLESHTGFDLDGVPYPYLSQQPNTRQHQISQEFQMNWSSGWIDVIGGLYFYKENISDTENVIITDNVTATGVPCPVGVVYCAGMYTQSDAGSDVIIDYRAETKAAAAYSQASFHLNDMLSLDLGVRYTNEQKSLDQQVIGTLIQKPLTAQSKRYQNASPYVGLKYDIATDLLTYLSVSNGYTSGGFNARQFSGLPVQYQPERLWAIQAGEKSQWLGRRLRLNADTFYYFYNDYQGQAVVTGSSFTSNIGKARLWGGEVELTALVTEQLRVSMSYAYLAQKLIAQSANALVEPYTQLPNAPKSSGNINATYTIPFTNHAALEVSGFYEFKSATAFAFPNDPTETQKAYSMVDGSIAYLSPDRHWKVTAYGRNLTNTEYRTFAQHDLFGIGIATLAIFAPPREYGMRVDVNF